MKKYKYLSAPFDKAEVRKLNEQGYKVLDARFAPEDQADAVQEKPKKTTRKTTAKKAK